MLDVYNEELIGICEADTVAVIDLASKIPHSTEYFYDLTHFNEKAS